MSSTTAPDLNRISATESIYSALVEFLHFFIDESALFIRSCMERWETQYKISLFLFSNQGISDSEKKSVYFASFAYSPVILRFRAWILGCTRGYASKSSNLLDTFDETQASVAHRYGSCVNVDFASFAARYEDGTFPIDHRRKPSFLESGKFDGRCLRVGDDATELLHMKVVLGTHLPAIRLFGTTADTTVVH